MPDSDTARASGVIDPRGLQALIDALVADGYQVLGPTLRDQAVVYAPLDNIEQLPAGWTDSQQPGAYRLQRRADRALFGYAVGPDSWKRWLHPPRQTLWSLQRDADGTMSFAPQQQPTPPLALLGARPCELHALQLLDRVLLEAPLPDTAYARRRAGCFVVAVQCGDPSSSCFCTSMAGGPRAATGFDLALTELPDPADHRFVVEVGSAAGAAMLQRVEHVQADPALLRAAQARTDEAARGMRRRLDTDGLQAGLQQNPEHPHWQQVAQVCLGCGNCTMVCPTCFCTRIDEHSDLALRRAWRERLWDSCFTEDFSYIHGGSVRASLAARYRHWLSHKLAHWIDEFGSAGCVGCGRCITWCPAAIELTREVAILRNDPQACDHAA